MLYRQQSKKKKLLADNNIKLTLITMRDNSRSLRDIIRLALTDPDVILPEQHRIELQKSITYLDDVYFLLNRLKSEIK